MSYVALRLIRHAEASHMAAPDTIAGRSPDATLTDIGREQAAARGEAWLREGYTPDVVDSSPISRCLATASIALKAAGLTELTPHVRSELAEMCQGSYEGQPRTPEIARQMEREGGSFRGPGLNSEGLPGESFHDVAGRWVTYLSEQAAIAGRLDRPRQTAAFTHRVALGTALSYLSLLEERPADDIDGHAIRDQYMATRETVPVGPCSETLLIVEPGADGRPFQARVEYAGRPV